ncbi:MAG: right-handed parallel beta-helix repeat-containing protein [Phycisphaerales bacterium]|nr:MAG: right-handed parallel beta-helix repeat-containing protein [Phycisphaerales bacterium]
MQARVDMGIDETQYGTQGTTRFVPGQYPTIQAAINASTAGDTVVVSPGTYYENINFYGKAITVKSTDPADWTTVQATVINGNAAASVATFVNGESASSILEGFALTNGYAQYGGAIYIDNYSSPTIRRCYIHDNHATAHGGGLHAYWGAPTIENCRFIDNTAAYYGGAMNVMCCGVTARDCIFASNSANEGGAVLAYYCNPYYGIAIFTNCTFAENHADNHGGAFDNYYSEPQFTNCILWGDWAPSGQEIYDHSGAMANALSYCDVQGGWPGTGNINADPSFADDYHLADGSPCVNRGDPAYAPQPGETDIDGEDRIQSMRIDMGADETPYARSWYVSPSGNNTDGLSWATAFWTIQQGINAATLDGDVVLVDQGTYQENINFYGRAITLQNTDPTNWELIEQTVIDGGENGPVVTFSNNEESDSILKGFVIINGKADNGGGIHISGANPTISLCVIYANEANIYGGGIYINVNEGIPSISNCLFYENKANVYGGGIYNCGNAGPTVTCCEFLYNSAWLNGGAVCSSSSTTSFKNCVFGRNSSQYGSGGAVANFESTANVLNCTFGRNQAYSNGGAIYNNQSNLDVSGSILWSDGALGGGNELYNQNSNITVTYSDIEGGYTGTGNINSDPRFVDTIACDLRLWEGSPCINRGDPDYPAGETDIEGEPRVQGGRIDIGAYETPHARWWYVRPGAANPDGLSWATAFPTIQQGIDTASDDETVLVGPATYQENIDFHGKAITVRSTNPADWAVVEATIIDGGGASGSKGVNFANGEPSTAVLDGLTVTNASYGIYCDSADPNIKHCRIVDPPAGASYGIRGFASGAIISNCVVQNTYYGIWFSGNSPVQISGVDSHNIYYGLVIQSSNGSSVSNSVLHNNGIYGLYVSYSDTDVINNLIYENRYGISLYNSPSSVISGCTIADSTSRGIYCSGTAPTITNSILWNLNADDLYNCTATYSCIEDGDPGTGNISADPLFVDAPDDDYHIKNDPPSPCVNAGDPAYTPRPAETDIDGDDRILEGRVDMGADEFKPQQPWLYQHGIKVGVAYYTWYGPGKHSTSDSLRSHLRPTPHIPQLGENYDSADPAVIDGHITMSEQANIHFWVCSWWGPGHYTDITFRKILDEPNAGKLRYAIYYESVGRLDPDQNPDTKDYEYANLIPDFEHLATNYFQHENYLRVNEKPVVFLYVSRAYFDDEFTAGQAALQAMRDHIADLYQIELYLVGDHVWLEFLKEDDLIFNSKNLFEAVTAYDVISEYFGKGEPPYGEIPVDPISTDSALSNLADRYGHSKSVAEDAEVGFIPSAMPGFNNRWSHIPQPPQYTSAPRYASDKVGAYEGSSSHGDVFKWMLRDIVVPMVDLGENASKMLMITSFNEWHEDTQIEPTLGGSGSTSLDDCGNAYTQGFDWEDYGDRYLTMLREETTWTVLTYDKFTLDVGSYTLAGPCSRWHTHGHPDWCVRMSGTGSFYHTDGIDVETPDDDYNKIQVDFWFQAKNTQSGDSFEVQYYDGDNWNSIGTYTSGTDFQNDTFYNKRIEITEGTYAFPNNMKMKFVCNAPSGGYVYIDEIVVRAIHQ